jgi:uncharacterized protein
MRGRTPAKSDYSRAGGVMDAQTVARLAVHGLLAGKRLVIPGLTNRLLAHSVGVMPRELVLRVSRSLLSPGHG